MEPDGTYQGWTNYETWCVSLWLNNEYPCYTALNNIAAADEEDSPSFAEKELQQFVEQQYDMPETGLFADLLTTALARVNWRQIIDAAKER